MQEVANNIENRTTFADVKRMIELKVERSEVQYMLQNQVHDEIRGYMDKQRLNNPKQDELNEEIRIMKRKLEDAVYNMQAAPKIQTIKSAPPIDNSRLLEQFESRLNDL